MAESLFDLFLSYRNLGDYLSWRVSPVSSFINRYLLSSRRRRSREYLDSCWKDLSDDLANIIMRNLSVFDRIRMNSVTNWNMKGMAPSPNQLPWLFTQDFKFFDFTEGKVIDLNLRNWANKGYLLGFTSNGWLIYAQRNFNYTSWMLIYKAKKFIKRNFPYLYSFVSNMKPTLDPHVFLLNPFSNSLYQLPSMLTISDYKHEHSRLNPCKDCFFQKIIVSSWDISKLVVAAHISATRIVGGHPKLALCRPGDKEWVTCDAYYDQDDRLEDMFFNQGCLLVLIWRCNGKRQHVEDCKIVFGGSVGGPDQVMKIKFISNSILLRSIPIFHGFLEWLIRLLDHQVRYYSYKGAIPVQTLVESANGQMLIVIKTVLLSFATKPSYWRVETGDVFVFQMDPEIGDFKRMNDIGDQIVFIGWGGSQCISATNLVGIRGNSIYFTEQEDWYAARESGVYSLDDGKFQRCFPHANYPYNDHSLGWFMPVTNDTSQVFCKPKFHGLTR